MDAVVDFLRRLPDEISRMGGSLAWRAGLFALALLLNLGFYLPSLPDSTPGTGVPGLDKAVHLLVFALTVYAAGRLLAPRKRFPMGWIIVVALVHAPFIELVQLVVLPQRSGDGADILFDVIGIALGLGLWIGDRLRRRTVGIDHLEPEVEPEPVADGHR
ncbi:MAG: VanZ family protein [Brachybacterium sp.]|nr:VanZ family protein [Brachybacterium sp.]MDN5899526.1 VanZ family protein [Brachybacterium sp.]